MSITNLKPGEKFFLLCSECSTAVNVEEEGSIANENEPNKVKEDANRPRIARMAGYDTGREQGGCRSEFGLKWMVYPLSHAKEENTKCTYGCWLRWKLLEEANTSQDKHNKAKGHEHFVPMIKRELLKWGSQFRRLVGL